MEKCCYGKKGDSRVTQSDIVTDIVFVTDVSCFFVTDVSCFFVTDIVFVQLCLSQMKVLKAHVLKYVINR